MDIAAVIEFVQEQFTDGLVLVVGSGLSAAEGLPGMPALASHLISASSSLKGDDASFWKQVEPDVISGGLESAFLKHPPPASLESWISTEVCNHLVPYERTVIGEVISGKRILRLTQFLAKTLKPANGLPILTPNYDRLIEVACEAAGFHVDTTAIGLYAGTFDHTRSCMGSCRGVLSRGRTMSLDHFPRAVVLKPHGSFDWYRHGGTGMRCSVDIEAERLIITLGLNKYKAGYSASFDKHRELANDYINRAARLLVVGYGFNDDHLQTHLEARILDGTPTLVLSRSLSNRTIELASKSPNCVCLSRPSSTPGVNVLSPGGSFEQSGMDLWDLGVLTKELLS